MTQPPGWNPGYGGAPLPPPMRSPYGPPGAVPPPPPPMYRPAPQQGYTQQGYTQQGYPQPGYGMPPSRPVMPPPIPVRQPPQRPSPMGPWQPQPPPRRPSRGPILAVVLVAVAILGVGALGLVGIGKSQRRSDTGYDFHPTNSASPTTGTSKQPSTTSAPGSGSPVFKLADNPLFTASGPSPTNCSLPRWQTTPSVSQAYFTAALPCLDAAWAPVLKAAKLPFKTPKLAFPTGSSWSSPCGSVSNGEAAAFYCSADNTLYMPFSGLQTEDFGARPGVYLAVFAHEYGHHVQDLTGMMKVADEQMYDSGSDSPQSLEVSRRLELQAQCFSGLFLAATSGRGSVDASVVKDAAATQERGDHGARRDHGTDAHTQGWWNQGFQKKDVAQCNTWRASSADVD